jgi:signal transduction histidine kinase
LRPGSAQATEAHRRLQEADRHYSKAVALFRADQPGVRDVMVTAMALAPMNPAYYLPLARACRDRGMDLRAADLYRKYLVQKPPPEDATMVRRELESLPADSSPFPLAFDERSGETVAPAEEAPPLSAWWVALAGLPGGLLLWRWRARPRRRQLRDLVLDRPELHQTVAYQIGCLRHEFLKHRVGAVAEVLRGLQAGRATAEQRRFMEERLGQGEPLLVAWRTHLTSLQRSLGARMPLESSDPLFREARRALEVLAAVAKPGLQAKPHRLADAQATLARLDRDLVDLVNALASCRVDEAFLREVVDSTRAEWASGRVAIDHLHIEPAPEPVELDVYRTDLGIVLKNVVRNAIQALDRSPPPRRLAIDMRVDLEPTGEEVVRLRVQDSSEESFAQSTGTHTVEHGLGIVAVALQRYDGSLEVSRGDPGYAKAVVIRLFRSQRNHKGAAA